MSIKYCKISDILHDRGVVVPVSVAKDIKYAATSCSKTHLVVTLMSRVQKMAETVGINQQNLI
jgi:hypothetical protein